jgi:hypothetical protein
MVERSVKNTVAIPIAKIVVGERHRSLEQAKVDDLAESISAIGLQHPITVYRRGDEFHLVGGAHRLEAAKKLGWSTIEAVKITDGNRELWEIDENLVRAELSAVEMHEHLQRKKALWEARRADAEAENNGAPCATNRGRGRPKGFAAEKAAALGKSKSQINRLIAGPKAEGEKPRKPHTEALQRLSATGFSSLCPALPSKTISTPRSLATTRAICSPWNRRPMQWRSWRAS